MAIALARLGAPVLKHVPMIGKTEVRPGDVTVFFGNSISEDTANGNWYQQLCATLDLVYTGDDALTYIEEGVGGDYLEDMLARVEADCIDHEPTLVFIEGGVNDARNGITTTAASLDAIITAIWAADPDVRIVVVGPCIDGVALPTELNPFPNPNDEAIVDTNNAMRAVCIARGVTFIDLRTAFEKTLTQAEATALSSDGVHPVAPHGRAFWSGRAYMQLNLR
jgi:lysophospholipase L1-like esterase